eukprot:s280_g18.t1
MNIARTSVCGTGSWFKTKFVLVFALATLAALFALPGIRFVYLGSCSLSRSCSDKKDATEPVVRTLVARVLFCFFYALTMWTAQGTSQNHSKLIENSRAPLPGVNCSEEIASSSEHRPPEKFLAQGT